MMGSNSSSTVEEEQQQHQKCQIGGVLAGGRALKEGERILAPTRRPDGTLRKPIRIRAGYVPQDEVAIYQSKGALLRKGMPEVSPPGYDPLLLDAKPKTKSAKRNERKKEKKQRQQDALTSSASDKGKNLDPKIDTKMATAEDVGPRLQQDVESVAHNMNVLSLSVTPSVVNQAPELSENPTLGSPALDLDKKIRALKKKIRLTEAQQQGEKDDLKPEQLEKVAKLEGWRKELKLLEEKKAALVS